MSESIEELRLKISLLEAENKRLIENQMVVKNWDYIKNSIIGQALLPLGIYPNHYTMIVSHIGGLIKEYCNVNKLARIDATTFDKASSIATDIVEVLTKYECSASDVTIKEKLDPRNRVPITPKNDEYYRAVEIYKTRHCTDVR